MNKLLNSWKMEITLTLRGLWIWPILLSGLVMSGLGFNAMIEDFAPGDALSLSGFIVQGGLLVSMLFGHSLVRREAGSNSDEVFTTLPNGYGIKITAKFLALLTLTLVFSFLSLAILFVLYWSYKVPAAFYWKSISYLTLYWVIPFWITGVIGMIFGFWIKSRLVYPVLVVIWLFTGPLNVYTWRYLMAIVNTDLSPVANFFNLGQTDPNNSFNPVYGFPMEIHRWLQKALWLVVVTFLLAFLTFRRNYRKGLRFSYLSLLVLAVLLLPLIFLFTREEQVLLTRFEPGSVDRYDLFYYMKNTRPNFTNENSFAVESYDIALRSFRNLRANVKVKIRPVTEADNLVFTLYRDLKVKKVVLGEGTLLTFKQVGDQVKVILPSRLKQNESTLLTFEYTGTSSPYFFANEQAAMLPAYFPWLPVAGSSQAMKTDEKVGGALRYPLNPQRPTEYILRYSGPKPMFTNLPKTKEGEWRGIVSNGVTLAAGMLTEKNMGQTKIYYPVSLYNMVNSIPPFLAEVEKVADAINRDLGIQNRRPQEVFFLSIPREASFISPDIWTFGDHLIVGVTQMDNRVTLSSSVTDIPLVPAVLTSMTRSNQMLNQAEEMRNLYTGAYEYWYYLKHGYQNPKRRLLDRVTNPVSSDLIRFIEKNQGDEGLLKSFFEAWLKRMNEDRKMTPAEVQGIINKVKESN